MGILESHGRFIIVVPSGCWIWIGGRNPKGYGVAWLPGSGDVKAHRLAYELAKGPIPAGLQIDHLCRDRACCNPDHLEVVTSKENTMRGAGLTAANARKTHCNRGHEFTPENTATGSRGQRECRACRRIRDRRRYWRNACRVAVGGSNA